MAERKNILILAAVFPPEPVVSASLLFDLAEELSKNYKVTVLRPIPTRPMGFVFSNALDKILPFDVLTINSYTNPKSSLLGRFYESYSMGKKCVHYIKEHIDEIDLIYNAPWQLIARFQVAKISIKHKIPYVIPVQDVYPESITSKLPNLKAIKFFVNKLLLPFDKFALKNAAKIHTISYKMVDYLSETRQISKDKFVAIHNWQNEEEFIKYGNRLKLINAPTEYSPFTYMYMGNIGPLAGLETVIMAFVKANLKNCKLVIAGSGSAKKRLISLVAKQQITNIEFWNVPEGKVPEIQSRADVMLLPIKKGYSLTSVPSKLPAYLFSSKPVLASVDYNSEIANTINSANSGWIVDPENEFLLCKAFQNIFKLKKDKLTLMGKNGFEYSITKFSKQKNLPKLVDCCIKILEK